jgi:hypothetical protein
MKAQASAAEPDMESVFPVATEEPVAGSFVRSTEIVIAKNV